MFPQRCCQTYFFPSLQFLSSITELELKIVGRYFHSGAVKLSFFFTVLSLITELELKIVGRYFHSGAVKLIFFRLYSFCLR